MTAVIAALILADVATALATWTRLFRRGFLVAASVPSWRMARRIVAFGSRVQLGSLLGRLNLRFDFVFLPAIAGPAVLGIYALACKDPQCLRMGPSAHD